MSVNEWSDATAMAEAVRNKTVSPRELVKDTISEAERTNTKINAIVSQRYEKALEEAETRDFSDKPFAGVPIFLKDLGQEQAGEPSTAGSRLFTSYRAKETDNYVKKLEELGFIILGRSSTPEFGFKNISDAQIHGPVNLPDDVRRNAGGSSGGAAAIVRSGISPLAPASDGGGSIRIPASFNGLIGLKPTRGRIPVGPGSFRESPFILPKLSKDSLEQPVRPLKIAFSTVSPISGKVSESAISATKKAARALESLGHHVHEITYQPLSGIEAMQSYYIMNSVETAAMFDGIEAGLGRQMTLEDMELMTWAIFQSGQKIPAKVYSKVLTQWDQYSHQMANFHESYDILLTPTVADVAPKHGQFALSESLQNQLKHMSEFDWPKQQELIWDMFADSLDWTPFTQQANLTGQPSISLPVYRDGQGLSLGVQLTAAKGREDLLLHLAQQMEEGSVFS
ncbi:MAG: amidase [Streptococcus salivarius]|nr:amidase [Streptococcus salivarius]